MRVILFLLICAGLAAPAPAQSLSLEPNPAVAARRWRPGKNSPRAAAAPAGAALVFPCPLRQGMERVYWDRDISLNLNKYPTFELDIDCPDPEAVRRLGLYFKSGAGWFVWLKQIPGAGRRKIVFDKSDAGTEGRPAGWNRIDGIRIGVWPAAPVNTTLTLHGLTARRPAVIVVRGTLSTPNQAERNAAGSAARRISRRLDELGIAYSLVDDEEVSAGGLAGARVAILPYNPYPPARELNALRSFIRRGGKLLVFYGAEPELAELMGLKLGEYKRAGRVGQWSAFKFTRGAPEHIPTLVTQESNNIRPAVPASRSARVIAWWRDAAGRTSRDPAWIQSDGGFWMSHILLEGDDENKKMLLLALLGHCDQSVWADAAAAASAAVGQIAQYHNLPGAFAGISAQAAANNRQKSVAPHLALARKLHEFMRQSLAEDDYPAAVRESRRIHSALLKAYAAAQKPRPGEFRGVWNHSGTGLYPGDWPRTCRLLKASGMTAVFPNQLWAGTAHYPSGIVPESDVCKTLGDQMKQASAAARAVGLEFHLWKVCWNLGNARQEYVDRLRRAGRLQRTDKNEELPWLCPSHPENIQQELLSIREAAAGGLIDGLHLDYIRFPGAHACYCNECRRQFEKWLGRSVRGWPGSARSGAHAAKFQEWRRLQITDFVRQVRQALREINPRIKLSAAVYQGYPACRDSIGQDWGAWLSKGLVDFVVPMNYTENSAEFSNILRRQCSLARAGRRIFPGIGVTAAESRLSPDMVIDQILRARARNCAGFVLFDLNPALAEETLPLLRLGITAP